MERNATPHSEDLTPGQQNALTGLITGETATEAATTARVHRSTIHRWLKDPDFQAEFNRLRTDEEGRARTDCSCGHSRRLASLDGQARGALICFACDCMLISDQLHYPDDLPGHLVEAALLMMQQSSPEEAARGFERFAEQLAELMNVSFAQRAKERS